MGMAWLARESNYPIGNLSDRHTRVLGVLVQFFTAKASTAWRREGRGSSGSATTSPTARRRSSGIAISLQLVGKRAGDALTDTVIGRDGRIGLLNDWRDPERGGRRAGWANGTATGTGGDGVASTADTR